MAGIRARRRPRVWSVNFRRLRYVLIREAAFMVLSAHLRPPESPASLRRYLALEDRQRIERMVADALHRWPELHHLPRP